MIRDIINGIAVKINEVFGDDYRIYSDEEVKQGLKEPCFFIALAEAERKQGLGKRYFCQNSFDIAFFPSAQGNLGEIETVAERLYNSMNFIELANGDLLRGVKMRHKVKDGNLHFYLNYNVFVIEREDVETMGYLTVTV